MLLALMVKAKKRLLKFIELMVDQGSVIENEKHTHLMGESLSRHFVFSCLWPVSELSLNLLYYLEMQR